MENRGGPILDSMPNDFQPDPEIRCRDFRIGCIGAGFIMKDVQLAAYHSAGFPVIAIASRTPSHAREAAVRWSIPRTYDHPFELIEDRDVQIVDIAFPPDQQPTRDFAPRLIERFRVSPRPFETLRWKTLTRCLSDP